MANLPWESIQRAVWWLSFAGQGLLLVRLASLRLAVRFVAFSIFLAASVGRDVLMLLIGDPGSLGYAIAFMATEPLVLGLLIWATIEIFAQIAGHYPDSGREGTRILGIVLLMACGICLLSLGLDVRAIRWHASTTQLILQIVMLLRRSITTALGLTLLLTSLYFFWHMPLSICRNVKVHLALMTAYLSAQTVGFWWQNVFAGHGTEASNSLLLGFSVACLAAWAALLKSDEQETILPTLAYHEALQVKEEHRGLMETLRRAARRR
jgi:hypothetical protein